jgi:hypothetical protein
MRISIGVVRKGNGLLAVGAPSAPTARRACGPFVPRQRGYPTAMKVLFAPIGIGAGLLAGFVAQKAFDRIWAAIDDEDPPEPDRRGTPVAKLVAALAIEGAVFRIVKGLTDRGVRSGFATLTGRWPGEDPTVEDSA